MLPERRFEIVSALAPTEVHDRLATHVVPRPAPGSLAKVDRPYFGTIALASFDLAPVDERRFLARAEGRVVPSGTGSLVSIRLRMLPVARLGVAVWIALASLAFVAVLAGIVRDGILRGFAWVHALPVLFVALFPIAAIVVPRRGFRRSARPLEEFLRQTLNGDVTR